MTHGFRKRLRDSHVIGSLLAARRAHFAQWSSETDLRRIRALRLQHTLARAQLVSPFYRDLWRGIDVASVREPADLTALPLVGKPDLRGRLDEVIAPGAEAAGCLVGHTSGSTGQTMRLVRDLPNADYVNAVWLRAHLAYGFRPWHRMAYLKNLPARKGITDRLGIFRSYHVPYDLPADQIWQRVLRIRPHILGGYPSHLRRLITQIPEAELRRLTPKFLNAGSENLDPRLRERLEEIFRCPVIDLYGAEEFGNVAFQCAHGRRHFNDDTVIVEVIGPDGKPVGPDVVGELAVTGLRNDAMQLVRYLIGDRGAYSAEECPCGRAFTVMHALEGRSTDAIVTPEGDRFTFTVLCEFVHRIPGLHHFQLLQDTPGLVTVRTVCRPGTEEAVAASVVEILSGALGHSVTVRPVAVDRIAPSANGKTLPVVSSVVSPLLPAGEAT